jgi:hypothetical protein
VKHLIIIFTSLISSVFSFAQYPPPAGQLGSTAIYKDSSVFIEWATSCEVIRGWMNIADTTLGKASFGLSANGTGKANNSVVSLGDGGNATLYFKNPIVNGNGWDFAIFENSFDDTFLELAFVEISSDGINFFRFPSVSLTQTQTQIDGFGTLDATKINNLAGKYKAYYGTPFDLEEMKNEPGLNLKNVIAIRIIDVIGSIEQSFACFDSNGNIINDPWPTPFESSGFDLDAVGVINNTVNSNVDNKITPEILAYPNPCKNFITVNGRFDFVEIFNTQGIVYGKYFNKTIDLKNIPNGLIILKVYYNNKYCLVKVIKK